MRGKISKILCIMLLSIVVFSSAGFAASDYYSSYITLKYGMTSEQVTNLQNDLRSLGYFNTTATGYFGSVTKQAVISYQRDNYLAADGIVGHATAREIKIDKIIKASKGFYGVPYVWGGSTPSGFDCSGFTQYVLAKNGITIPRTTSQQYNTGTWVSKSNLKQGDLVFFTTYQAGPSHVGIYIGNNQFIHASSSKGVTITDLSNSYYAARYIGAKRVIN